MDKIIKFNHKIDKFKIFSRLQIKENMTVFYKSNAIFDELSKVAFDCINFTNVYSIQKKHNFFGIKTLDCCEKHVLCFVSCGDEITAKIDEIMLAGNYLDAYILDGICVEILFNLYDQMNEAIKTELNLSGYNLTKRFSPGENDMDMKYQKYIFDSLNERTHIDAYLTEDLMISPIKSMLYMFGADKNIADKSLRQDCGKCDNIYCSYRDDILIGVMND